MLAKPFQQGKIIIETIERFHHEAYFVGGAVRDLLLNKEVNDIDITTSASPEEIKQMFESVIPIGIDHGTVLVRKDGISYEVTTFRNESETNDTKSLQTDLKYRDFTINAIAMDKNGNLTAEADGEKDLENRVIRAVDSPKDRFKEDPLRIIRALRFVSELGFDIDEETLKWMKTLKPLIKHLAVERITAEMIAFFNGPHVNKGLDYLKETAIHHYLPLFNVNKEIIKKLPAPFIPLSSFGEVVCLLHHIEPTISINQWIKSWKGSNAMKREATQLSNALTYYKANGIDLLLVYELERPLFAGFCRLVEMNYPDQMLKQSKLDELYDLLPIKSRKDINFNGHDLMTLFPNIKRGRWISEMIKQIEEAIILHDLKNNYEQIEEWVLCNPPEVN